MKRIITFLLAFVLIFSFAGCVNKAQYSQEELAILQQRRDEAESYMRYMATVLWRAEENIIYSNSSSSTDPLSSKSQVHIVAGRLYQGIPYSHAAGGPNAFLEYAGEPDENGIYQISGLTWHPLNGSNKTARIGNDCASALGLAWGRLGNSLLQDSSTKYMTADYGYLRVGEYESNSDANTYTIPVCEENGYDVMAAAYAQLQKADGLVRRYQGDTNGHAIMVVSVNVEKTADGAIDGNKSYITTLEQTSNLIEQERYEYNEQLGENVYLTYIIDKKYTFFELFAAGYLPVTCKELIDPSPVAEPTATDSLTECSIDTLFQGTLNSTRFMESVTVQICDKDSNVVQQCTASPTNRKLYTFDMQTFKEDPPEVLRGSIDLEALSPGTYQCNIICRLITGDEIQVRTFEFTA